MRAAGQHRQLRCIRAAALTPCMKTGGCRGDHFSLLLQPGIPTGRRPTFFSGSGCPFSTIALITLSSYCRQAGAVSTLLQQLLWPRSKLGQCPWRSGSSTSTVERSKREAARYGTCTGQSDSRCCIVGTAVLKVKAMVTLTPISSWSGCALDSISPRRGHRMAGTALYQSLNSLVLRAHAQPNPLLPGTAKSAWLTSFSG